MSRDNSGKSYCWCLKCPCCFSRELTPGLHLCEWSKKAFQLIRLVLNNCMYKYTWLGWWIVLYSIWLQVCGHFEKTFWSPEHYSYIWFLNISFPSHGHYYFANITDSPLLDPGRRDVLPFCHKSISEVGRWCWARLTVSVPLSTKGVWVGSRSG